MIQVSHNIEEALKQVEENLSIDVITSDFSIVTEKKIYKGNKLVDEIISVDSESPKQKRTVGGKQLRKAFEVETTKIIGCAVLAQVGADPTKSPYGEITTYWTLFDRYNPLDWTEGLPKLQHIQKKLLPKEAEIICQSGIALEINGEWCGISMRGLLSIGRTLGMVTTVNQVLDEEKVFVAGLLATKLANYPELRVLITKRNGVKCIEGVLSTQYVSTPQCFIHKTVLELVDRTYGMALVNEAVIDVNKSIIYYMINHMDDREYDKFIISQNSEMGDLAFSLTSAARICDVTVYFQKESRQHKCKITENVIAEMLSQIEYPMIPKTVTLEKKNLLDLQKIIGSARFRACGLFCTIYDLKELFERLKPIEDDLKPKQLNEFRFLIGTWLMEV